MSTTQNHPIPDPKAVIQGDVWRVTVLTSGLVRIEFSADGQFEDRASTFAINRNLPVPKFTANKTETGGLELVTTTLRLSYDGKAFSPSGLQAYGVFPRMLLCPTFCLLPLRLSVSQQSFPFLTCETKCSHAQTL